MDLRDHAYVTDNRKGAATMRSATRGYHITAAGGDLIYRDGERDAFFPQSLQL